MNTRPMDISFLSYVADPILYLTTCVWLCAQHPYTRCKWSRESHHSSSRAIGRKNRPDKSHPRTTTDPATKREQQTYRPDPTPSHETSKRKPGMPNKFRESTVHEITKEIPENIEKILSLHTIPPWRNDAKGNDMQRG